MFTNRVHETTTTTGTGNLTLSGAATNMRAFASVYAIDQRLPYILDDGVGGFEEGIGYLSDGTTLVRESVTDSSNAGAAINITTETQVFVAASAHTTMPSFGYVAPGLYADESNLYPQWQNNTNLVINRPQMFPCKWTKPNKINAIGFTIDTVSVGKCRVGICRDVNGLPDTGPLLWQSGDIDTAVTGYVESSISPSLELYGQFWVMLLADNDTAKFKSDTENGAQIPVLPSLGTGNYSKINGDNHGTNWTDILPYSGTPTSYEVYRKVKFSFGAE